MKGISKCIITQPSTRRQVQDATTRSRNKKIKIPFTIVDDKHAKNKLLDCHTAQQIELIQRGRQKQINEADRDATTPSQMRLTLHAGHPRCL